MRFSVVAFVAGVLLGLPGLAGAIPVTLTAHNSRQVSGTLVTWKWASCTPVVTTSPCISPTNAWATANVTPSNAIWDWDPGTGVLSMTGTIQTTSHIGSSANGTAVYSDRVTDLVINTTTGVTMAASYRCIEGAFLAAVAVNGCLNLDLYASGDATLNSAGAYDVGGDANCVVRTIGGDDIPLGDPRGLSTRAAGGGCDATVGAFGFYTVASYTGPGGQLIVSNGIPLTSPNTSYLTFTVAPVPLPASAWTFAGALGLLGVARRKGSSDRRSTR